MIDTKYCGKCKGNYIHAWSGIILKMVCSNCGRAVLDAGKKLGKND
jgi:hypothetical protein